jgi:hypothetical protein
MLISLSLFSSSTIFRAILTWTHAFSRQRNCTFNSLLIVIFQHPLQEFSACSVVRTDRFSLHLSARTLRVKSTPNNRVERWTWTIHSFAKIPIHRYLRSNEEQHTTIFRQWHHWRSSNAENFPFFNFACVQKKKDSSTRSADSTESVRCLSLCQSFFLPLVQMKTNVHTKNMPVYIMFIVDRFLLLEPVLLFFLCRL